VYQLIDKYFEVLKQGKEYSSSFYSISFLLASNKRSRMMMIIIDYTLVVGDDVARSMTNADRLHEVLRFLCFKEKHMHREIFESNYCGSEIINHSRKHAIKSEVQLRSQRQNGRRSSSFMHCITSLLQKLLRRCRQSHRKYDIQDGELCRKQRNVVL
jgi:hypothetical protein